MDNTREPHRGFYKDMETELKEYDEGMLTFEDRYPEREEEGTYPGNEPGCLTKGVCGGCSVCGHFDKDL